jgi:hypothetical protein
LTGIQRLLEMRSLVDVLYDVQDVRMRTANRLRQMPGEASKLRVAPLLGLEKDLTDTIDAMLQDEPIYRAFLGKVWGVGPRISGSIIGQTMIRFEKVPADEYEQMTSQRKIETHPPCASQSTSETHEGRASHPVSETQEARASQLGHENQILTASHPADETHVLIASQMKSENHARLASQRIIENQMGHAFSLEQLRLAQKTENGDYLIPAIRGIGAFPTVSSYWAWWGLHVKDGHAPKRKRGDNLNWSPKMRTLAWKIGKQFVLQGRGYRALYDAYKDRLTAERMPLGACPQYEACKAALKKAAKTACKGHIDAMARRYAVKMFVSDLWAAWRRLEGLPITDPWIIAQGDHAKMRNLEEFLREEAEP